MDEAGGGGAADSENYGLMSSILQTPDSRLQTSPQATFTVGGSC